MLSPIVPESSRHFCSSKTKKKAKRNSLRFHLQDVRAGEWHLTLYDNHKPITKIFRLDLLGVLSTKFRWDLTWNIFSTFSKEKQDLTFQFQKGFFGAA